MWWISCRLLMLYKENSEMIIRFSQKREKIRENVVLQSGKGEIKEYSVSSVGLRDMHGAWGQRLDSD